LVSNNFGIRLRATVPAFKTDDAANLSTVDDLVAMIVWNLARRHTWGTPVSRGTLGRSVAGSADNDEVERILESRVGTLPFVQHGPRGYAIPNSRDAHLQTAGWLQGHTSLSDLNIGATLSRLPPEWPS
jgi:hypothetical protein